jgi:hypothetical protein
MTPVDRNAERLAIERACTPNAAVGVRCHLRDTRMPIGGAHHVHFERSFADLESDDA